MISALNVCTVEYDKGFNANFPIVDIDKQDKNFGKFHVYFCLKSTKQQSEENFLCLARRKDRMM